MLPNLLISREAEALGIETPVCHAFAILVCHLFESIPYFCWLAFTIRNGGMKLYRIPSLP